MILDIFAILMSVGISLMVLNMFFDKDWINYTSLAMWFVGLCGIIIVSLLNKGPEIQEPCRCEVCCKHGNE